MDSEPESVGQCPVVDSEDEGRGKGRNEDANSDDEEDEVDFVVDAIKCAYWKDGTQDHSDGKVGWYYGTYWSNYLKTTDETEEPAENFAEAEEEGDVDFVREFWSGFNRNKVNLRFPKNAREPREPSPQLQYPYVFECPPRQMKKWLKSTNGKRRFKTFWERRQFELSHPSEPVPRKLSDHYVWLRRKARLRRESPAAGKDGKGPKAESPTIPSPSNGKEKAAIASRKGREKEPTPKTKKVSTTDFNTGRATEAGPSKPRSTDTTTTKKRKNVVESSPSPELSSSPKRTRKDSPPSASDSKGKFKVPSPPKNRFEGVGKIKENAPSTPLFLPAEEAPSPHEVDQVLMEAQPLDEPPIADGLMFGEPDPEIFTPLPVSQVAPDDAEKEEEEVEEVEEVEGGSDEPEKMDVNVPASPALNVQPPTPAGSLFGSSQSGPSNRSPSASPARSPARKSRSPSPLRTSKSPSPAPSVFPIAKARPAAEQKPKTPSPVLAPSPAPLPQKPGLLSSVMARIRANMALPSIPSPTGSPSAAVPTPPASKPSSESSSHIPPPPGTDPLALPTERPVETPTSPQKKLDPANRPKYKQPVKMKFIDTPIDHRPIGVNGRDSLPTKPGNVRSPPDNTVRSPLGNSGRSHADPRMARSPLYGGQTPSHPSNQPPARLSASDFRPTPTGPAATHQPPTQLRNFDPDQSSNYGSRLPQTSWAPQTGANSVPVYNASADPRARSGLLSAPVLANQPLPNVAAVYTPSADPRRRVALDPRLAAAPGGTAPTSATPTPDPYASASPRAPVRDARRVSASDQEPLFDIGLCLPLRGDPMTVSALDVKLFKGASLGSGNLVKRFLHPPGQSKTVLQLEQIDAVCLTGTIGCGAKVVEWARVAYIDSGSGSKTDWELLKENVGSDKKVYVAYTELKVDSVSSHYALVFAAGDAVDLAAIGLGGREENVRVALFIVALPLSSGPAPLLPNPVRPDFDASQDDPPTIPSGSLLLDSYDLSGKFMASLRGKMVMKYPPEEPAIDVLHRSIVEAFMNNGVQPIHAGGAVDVVLIANQKIDRSLRSTSIRATIPRRTQFYAFGPSLQLFPSQWGVKRIWQSGGLVTFSPTFILRSPDKFAEIMDMIRPVDTWAAYVVPSMIEWCQLSWNEPARCPDAVKAFDTLNRMLFLDQQILQFSGSAASSSGGLAVSCAPPVVHATEACIRWMDWLRKLLEQKDFAGVSETCSGVRPGTFFDETGAVTDKSPELELVDVEAGQIEDLTRMRMRPHLLPYRRYLYIGEVSLDRKQKERLGAAIEYVAADDFAAIFSGAV